MWRDCHACLQIHSVTSTHMVVWVRSTSHLQVSGSARLYLRKDRALFPTTNDAHFYTTDIHVATYLVSFSEIQRGNRPTASAPTSDLRTLTLFHTLAGDNLHFLHRANLPTSLGIFGVRERTEDARGNPTGITCKLSADGTRGRDGTRVSGAASGVRQRHYPLRPRAIQSCIRRMTPALCNRATIFNYIFK